MNECVYVRVFFQIHNISTSFSISFSTFFILFFGLEIIWCHIRETKNRKNLCGQ